MTHDDFQVLKDTRGKDIREWTAAERVAAANHVISCEPCIRKGMEALESFMREDPVGTVINGIEIRRLAQLDRSRNDPELV